MPRASNRRIGATSSIYRFIYRISRGHVGSSMGKANILLMKTTGRDTGKTHTTPLIYIHDGPNFAVVAANAGSDQDPSWWLNLKARPGAEFQAGPRRFRASAEEASPEDRERLWPAFVAAYSGYDSYASKTNRHIPVVLLKDVTPL